MALVPELLLLPYERTTSYQAGTGAGPWAILPFLAPHPFPTWTAVETGTLSGEEYLERAAGAARRIVSGGGAVAAVGGEHTVTWGVLAGYAAAGHRPAVIQLDAHADLREEYEGTPWSHACVMRRVIDRLGLPTLGVGIRSLSLEEAEFAAAEGRPLVYAHALRRDRRVLAAEARKLPENVYLTVDIDFLDPSVVPGTGTPEPGGLGWYEGLRIIDILLEGRNLVGFDLVELSPAVEEAVSVRAAARLMEYLARRLK